MRSLANTNFRIILSGEAGSGKTTAAKLVAQALGRPYRVYTCHPDTDAYSLYGEIVPDTDEDDTVCTSKSFSEIMEEKGYPDLLDIEFDLEGSYEKLTTGMYGTFDSSITR